MMNAFNNVFTRIKNLNSMISFHFLIHYWRKNMKIIGININVKFYLLNFIHFIIVLLYIAKNNNLDYIEDLTGFFELLKGVNINIYKQKIIYDPQLYPVLKAKLVDRYRLFFPKDKVKYANKLSFLLETFFRNEE